MMSENPYVGPRPYGRSQSEQELFFGRVRESTELTNMVVADPVVLLYARSGAGKTSLINAGLIPALEKEEFEILPVARVSVAFPPGIQIGGITNIFAFSLIVNLLGSSDLCWGRNFTKNSMAKVGLNYADAFNELRRKTLVNFFDLCFQQHADKENDEGFIGRVLIIDQLEELVSMNIEYWQQREPFFVQLRQALVKDASLRLVLVIREDYLAQIGSYGGLLPGRLRSRYRLERLGEAAALDAVIKPADKGGRKFSPGAAELLVDKLLQARSQTRGGEQKTFQGEHVEPMVLQLVCRRLWEMVPVDNKMIREEHIGEFGDVGSVLQDYYDHAIDDVMDILREKDIYDKTLTALSRKLQATNVEVDINPVRIWIEKQLITAAGTRSLVHQDSETTGGMPNDAIKVLERARLIGREDRAGAPWYELTHDTFIEPILISNSECRRKNRTKDIIRESEKYLHDNPQRSVKLSLRAFEVTYSDDVKELLQRAVQSLRLKAHRRLHTFSGHTDVVNAVSISRDGCFIASASSDGTVLLWDRLTGRLVADIKRFPDKVFSVAFDPIGARIVSTHGAGWITIWQTANGNALCSWSGHRFRINAVTFDAEGRRIATASDDMTAKVWDADRGELLTTLRGHTDKVNWVAFAPDSKTLATASWDRTIRIWDAGLGKELRALRSHKDVVNGVGYHPNGKRVVSASWDRTARIWDIDSEAVLATMSGHTSSVNRATFSPDGNRVATVDTEGIVRMWNCSNSEELFSLSGHSGTINAIAFSADGEVIATGGWDNKVRLWRVSYEENALVRTVALCPDAKKIARASDDGIVKVLDIESDEILLTANVCGSSVTSLSFDGAGMHVVCATEDKNVFVLELDSGKEILRIECQEIEATGAVLSWDGRYVAVFNSNGYIRLTDISSRKIVRNITVPNDEMEEAIIGLAFSPDGKHIAAFSAGGLAKIWDLALREPGRTLRGHEGFITDFSFSPDGSRVATASMDGTVRIWNAFSGSSIHILSGYHGAVNGVAFSPDGSRVATASNDGVIKVWNVFTAEPCKEVSYEGKTGAFRSVVFAADGRRLIALSRGGTTQTYELEASTLIETAKKLLANQI